MKKNKLHIALLLALILSGCSSSDLCMHEMKVRLKAEFKEMKYDTSSEQYKEQAKDINVIVHGKGIDSLLYNKANISAMELPLQINDSTSIYVVKQLYATASDTSYVTDTIWVRHENSVEFVSMECGSVVIGEIKGVLWTINRIDSVTISDKNVVRGGNNNLKIYVKKT